VTGPETGEFRRIFLDIAVKRCYIRNETKVSSLLFSGNSFTSMPDSLVQLFLDAIKIDAQSLKERPMAQFVSRYLSGLPLTIREDDSAPLFKGECGNLILTPPGFDASRPAIALLAHMDTPRSTVHVRPVLSDARIQSDGTTALGVDNRAGTSVLLYVLREHLQAGGRGNYVVVLTVGEELGLYGSKYLDLGPYNVRFCFVFDCSKRPGTFIQSAVGCSLYDATFIGKSAHAAVAPEKGINAIQIAEAAISAISIGRISPTMTSNIGMIAGGSATNVVPDRCTIHGEVREFDHRIIRSHLAHVEEVFRKESAGRGGGLEFEAMEDFLPFTLAPDSDVVRMITDVLRHVGLEPNPISYLGGSDANMLNGKGIPAVNLGIGAQNPHGNDEFILLEDLQKAADIARELIARSNSLL
jgi:tripeptide aminopeptidase